MVKPPSDHYLKKELFDLIKSDKSIFEFIEKSSLDGMWYWDLENPENEWMDEQFWTVLGYNPEEMPHSPSSWQDIIFEDDLKIALDNFNKHINDPNHPYDQVVRYKHKDGHAVWIRCRGVAIRDEKGKPVRMLGAHNELTQLKEAQEHYVIAHKDVIKSKANIEAIIENTDNSIWSIDAEYNLTFVNQRFKKVFKEAFGHELQIGEKVINKLPEEIQPLWLGFYKRVLNGERFEEEGPVQISENKVIYTRTSFNPIISEGKVIGAAFYGKDITEEKLKEEELVRAKEDAERSKERFELAMQATSDGLMDWDLVTNEIYFSPRWKSIIGYTDSELPNEFKSWENNTRKEDAEKAYSLLMHNIENQIPHFMIEMKMRHKEGYFVDILARATIFFNEKGIAVRVVGTHTDITESKNATKKLADNELKFRKLIDNMPSGVAIYEPVNDGADFRFLNINKTAEEITNTSNKELVGQFLLERFPNMDKSPLLKNLKKVNETGENVYIPPFYYEDKKRKGWRENHIYKLQTGEIVAIFKDVTELKEAEERLKEQNKELIAAKEQAEKNNLINVARLNLIHYSEKHEPLEIIPHI
jgi:PAS domain S-box-containing protein